MKRVWFFLVLAFLCLPGNASTSRKGPADPRVRDVRTIFIKGNNEAAVKARQNLANWTCFRLANNPSRADATLDFSQQQSVSGAIFSANQERSIVSAELTAKDGDVLWSGSATEDAGLINTGAGSAARYVLYQLQFETFPQVKIGLRGLDQSGCPDVSAPTPTTTEAPTAGTRVPTSPPATAVAPSRTVSEAALINADVIMLKDAGLGLIAQSTGRTLKIQDATSIRLSLMESLSSATNSADDPVRFEVTADVSAGGMVVIPRGSTAVGHVVEVEPRRRLGRAGKLNFSIDHVKAPDGTNVRLRASSTRKGDDKTGTVIVGAVLLSPLFLIMRGKDVSIPKGTEVIAYVDGEREITLPGVVASAVAPAVPPRAFSGTALTNADVLKLKNVGLGDQLIIEKIKASPANYHLDTSDIIELKHAGLSDAVIGAMLEALQPSPSSSQPTQSAPFPAAEPTPAPAVRATGLVEVPFNSNPPGALVSFSGAAACNTPCVLKLEARSFRVTMTLRGYADWTGDITVEVGKSVAAEMQRAQ